MAYNQEKLRKINYEGEVTKVNYSLCYFEMDGIIEVYAGNFAVSHNKKNLPLINETIILKNVLLYDRTTFILTPKSKICNSNNKNESHLELMRDFKHFILENNLTPIEYKSIKLMQENLIDLQVEIIKDNVQYSQINTTSLLLDLLRDITVNISENEITSLTDMTIKLPSCFKTNQNIKEINVPTYIYWYMGINRSTQHEFLIGILNISNKSGFLMLSDAKFELPVLIAQNDIFFSKKIKKLLNHFVVIHKFIKITENYKDVTTVKYIYVDIDDIHIVEEANDSIVFNATKDVFTIENFHLFKFKIFILCKSSIIQKDKKRYFFIYVKYKKDLDSDSKDVFLQECIFRVSEEFLHLYPVLNENDTYSIYTNSKEFEQSIIKQEGDTIFTIFDKRLQSYNLPEDLKLKLIKKENDKLLLKEEEKLYIYSVEEAKEFLKTTENITNRKLVHVEGIISHRRFFPPLKKDILKKDTFKKDTLEKDTLKEEKIEAFGIPGKMVHNIVLSNDLKSESEEIFEPFQYVFYETDECYEEVLNQYFEGTLPNIEGHKEKTEVNIFMHNFENLLCPLGLVPDMRVVFKNVTAEKGKYFKPSRFTSIEVISYEPEKEYNSANLVLDSNNWGPQICLGTGNDIPTNTICWGTTIQMKITQLKIKFKCQICKEELVGDTIECCEQFDFFWNMSLTLIVRDAFGVCKITTNNEEILRILLHKEKNEWSLFSKSLKIIGEFLFYDQDTNESDNNGCDGDDDDDDSDTEYLKEPDRNEFIKSFSFILRAWNEAQIHHFDLRCRKMENKERTNDYLPFWWCLEARRSFDPDLFQENFS